MPRRSPDPSGALGPACPSRSRASPSSDRGVETRAEYDVCRALGFDSFHGCFFAEPLLVEGGTVPTHRLCGLAALARAGDGAGFEELERLITQDAGLAYKPVRLADSAHVGNRTSVASVRIDLLELAEV